MRAYLPGDDRLLEVHCVIDAKLLALWPIPLPF